MVFIIILKMGTEHVQSIKDTDLQRIPIYCMGFSSDIHFAAHDEHTNQVLTKLKQYEPNQLFKYRIRDLILLDYFCQNAHTMILLRPYGKREDVMGLVSISSKYRPKAQNIMLLLRRELKIDEKESMFLYQQGKLCQTHQPIITHHQENKPMEYRLAVLYYSKMEISG